MTKGRLIKQIVTHQELAAFWHLEQAEARECGAHEPARHWQEHARHHAAAARHLMMLLAHGWN